MRRIAARLVVSFAAYLVATQGLRGDILTAQYDTFRTSWNASEVYLNVANVNQAQFGKLFSRQLDGWVYAQPLYMQGLNIPGYGPVNVVFVCTANNTVYAFDADSASMPGPYWSTNLGPADTTPNGPGSPNSEPVLGIVSTPVIVPATQALYVVAATRENGHRVYRLHALDIATGQEDFGGPVVISGQVPGTSWDSVNGMVAFNPDFHLIRASLAATGDTVYVATAGSRDTEPFHGWIFGYSLSTLQQTAILNLTPNGQEGGVWQSVRAPVVDANGFLYVESGNGDYDGTFNFGDAILKLSTTQGLQVTDWFTPDTWPTINGQDLDLAAAGPLLVPGTTFLIGAGKTGILYVVDTTNMGQLQAGNGQIVQSFQAAPPCSPDGSTCNWVNDPVFWNNATAPMLYVWPLNEVLREYSWSNGSLVTTPVATGTLESNYPSGFLSGSSNNNTPGTGILWALTGDDGSNSGNGMQLATLRAFDATNITNEIWNSDQNAARDALGYLAKFVRPVVANGKVYAGTFSSQLVVYGLLPSALSISKSHSGDFTQGQSGAYTVTVSNSATAGPTNGTVTMTETMPNGLTLVSMAGTGWNCPDGGNTCTRSDPLSGGSPYPPITVTVNVSLTAASQVTNQVGVGGGGSDGSSAQDITSILPLPSQTITFTAPPNQVLGAAPFMIGAAASSGLAVSFASTTSMVCTVSGTTGSTVTMVSVGTCTIQATQAGSSSWAAATPVTQSFQVMAATLQSIAVIPASPTIAKGLTQQFTAIGTYSDSSTRNLTASVIWSATTGVAMIASSGLATTAGVGTSNITATLSNVTGSTVLTVTAATLQSIAVTPASPMIAKGLTQQFTAIGTYTDSSTQNLTALVTWASATTGVATIASSGLATAAGVGMSNITATLSNVTGSTVLTVTAATLQSIAVTPASPTIAKGLTQQFTAIGTYSDSSTQNLTALVTWASATTGVAMIASGGLATAAGVGTSNITATLSSVTGSTLLTVMAPMCNVTPDGVAGVADVQRMIDEALGIMPAVNDFNGDGVVNGADVQIVINAALGQGCTAP